MIYSWTEVIFCHVQSYLESFYNFCLNIGGETADVMCEILAFEADRRYKQGSNTDLAKLILKPP